MKNSKKKEEPLQGAEEFKGYSMEELRYHRALLLVKKEYVKEQAFKVTKKIKNDLPIIGTGDSLQGHLGSGNLLGKVMKGLSFADYVILGLQTMRIVKKIGSKFKKKQ